MLQEQSGALAVVVIKLLASAEYVTYKKARSALHTIRFSNFARRQSIMQALISFQMK
jgi:hypothetical protein